MKDIEQEFKWDASARGAFENFLQAARSVCENVRCAGAVHITDYYLDNAKGDFAAQRAALRIRHAGQCWQATLKSRSLLQNGLAVRQERTLTLIGVRSFRGALTRLEQRACWQGFALRDLREKFRICNLRRRYMCTYKGVRCEAALDSYITLHGGHQLSRREIELELKKGPGKVFAQLVEKISTTGRLRPAKISKVAGAEKWILQKFSLN